MPYTHVKPLEQRIVEAVLDALCGTVEGPPEEKYLSSLPCYRCWGCGYARSHDVYERVPLFTPVAMLMEGTPLDSNLQTMPYETRHRTVVDKCRICDGVGRIEAEVTVSDKHYLEEQAKRYGGVHYTALGYTTE